MAVVVTGAAGFIGSHLTERLLAAGERVIGIDNFDEFYAPATKHQNLAGARDYERFVEVAGDLRDPSLYARIDEPVDMVVHLAARAGVRPSIADPVLYVDVNVNATQRLLEWMRQAGVRNLVFASSSSVYGDRSKVPFSESDFVGKPISPYAATKRAGELQCHTYHHLFGLSVAALRFFTVYGPRQRPDLAIHKFARLMRAEERIPMFGDGSTERDYTYIDDILQGVLGAIDFVRSPEPVFEIINLGESQTISLRRMIETLASQMGVSPDIEQLPTQPGDVPRTFADVSKARQLLGYAPSTDFDTGIQKFLEWFDAQGTS